MRNMITTVAVLGGLTLFGCGGDETTTDPGARVDSLCRDWCTCSGDANPSCLDECVYNTTEREVCDREEDRRYYSCIVDREVDGVCMDPFDDCVSDVYQSESWTTCREEMDAKCEAQCAATPNCVRIDGNGTQDGVGSCVDVCRWGGTCEQAVECAEFQLANPGTNCDGGPASCWAYGTGVCGVSGGTPRSAL